MTNLITFHDIWVDEIVEIVSKIYLVKVSEQDTANPGGGTRLYGLYRYLQPQRVWFFSRFGHK